MGTQLRLGDLICSLYEEYRQLYGDNELAAVAADVALTEVLLHFNVQDYLPEDVSGAEGAWVCEVGEGLGGAEAA